ncbi:MAG: T9SS type A sorting domain-containing protein [Porphyromonadaceae bacterium]|nr:T9SS type A sorting domain-containing protein [Porphyromonadaceae bacterium]
MNKIFQKMTVAILAVVFSASLVQAQEVNMDRYITMTIKDKKKIWIRLWADADNTKIKIKSGNKEQTVTVDNKWAKWQGYTAEEGTGTMIIYGNVKKLDCSNNASNITGLEIKHNTQLQDLLCYSNSITSLDVSHNIQLKVLGCFSNSITSLDVGNNAQLIDLDCHKNKITSLDVSNNIQLTKLFCMKNSITSLDVSNNTQLKLLNCSENKISTLDVSKNTQLDKLYCAKNSITSLDINKNEQLTGLDCSENQISTFDLSKNTQLEWLYCYENSITSLDISKNTQLKNLRCYNNRLTVLDVSKNTQLEWLYCHENSITSLDISKNTQLKDFVLHNNNFTTAVIDDIYCYLPDRRGKATGIIRPVLNASSSEKSKILASNGKNATDKNWKIMYYKEKLEITGFTGTHTCTSNTEEVENISSLLVYPNPVKDILHITSDKPIHSIHVYDVYGMEVLHAVNTNSINVSHLQAGVYMVHIDGKIMKVIKE